MRGVWAAGSEVCHKQLLLGKTGAKRSRNSTPLHSQYAHHSVLQGQMAQRQRSSSQGQRGSHKKSTAKKMGGVPGLACNESRESDWQTRSRHLQRGFIRCNGSASNTCLPNAAA